MRIGFDVDGVLADFIAHYRPFLIKHTGKDLFPAPGWQTWDWDFECGYARADRDSAFAAIAASPRFWKNLPPLGENVRTLALVGPDIQKRHDLYFITNRGGATAKTQTEEWLQAYIGIALPTVLISGAKGLCASALRLDAYVDDNLPNLLACVEANAEERRRAGRLDEKPKFETRLFLMKQEYNVKDVVRDEDIRRVGNMGQMMDYLLLDL